jgi:UPF0755 protein
MKLDADPTLIYAVFNGAAPPPGYRLTNTDKLVVSPYNTYANIGLPPGPIANPGRASLEAAANPSRTRDLYFVADGSGGHVFAETFEDHQRNVARYRSTADAALAVVPMPASATATTPTATTAAAPAAAKPAGQPTPQPRPATRP